MAAAGRLARLSPQSPHPTVDVRGRWNPLSKLNRGERALMNSCNAIEEEESEGIEQEITRYQQRVDASC